ncbi:MAG: hypothetical protein R6U94_03660, partial [Nitriliruptoraceae bacterium]
VALHLLELFGLAEDRIQPAEDRPGHDQRYSLDTSLVSALGWQPERSLMAAGLEDTVAWYRANERWWRPLKAAGSGLRRGSLSAR